MNNKNSGGSSMAPEEVIEDALVNIAFVEGHADLGIIPAIEYRGLYHTSNPQVLNETKAFTWSQGHVTLHPSHTVKLIFVKTKGERYLITARVKEPTESLSDMEAILVYKVQG
jgi:hypothetical protein